MQTISRVVGRFIDELTSFLEPSRKPGRRRSQYTLVERGDEFECYRARRGGPKVVAKGRLDRLKKGGLPRKVRGEPIEFRLDGSRVLTKIMQLPAASREYLDAVVKHQLDRVTPWAADRVVYDYEIAEDEPAPEGQIAVRLVATSRDVFERSMGRLSAAGVRAVVVGTSEDPIDRPSMVNLLHTDRAERAALRRKVSVGLAAFVLIAAVLSALTGWQLYDVRTQETELTTEIDTVRTRIETARAGNELQGERQKIVEARRDAVPMVVLVDRLSSVIPANTYLTLLSVEEGEVQIAGYTSDAPALIGILENADVLSNVRFVAPTMRDEGETRDRFEIAAAIVAETPDAPTD